MDLNAGLSIAKEAGSTGRVKRGTGDQVPLTKWYVYIVEARDQSFYTGITTDIEKRLQTHNSGKGSKSLLGKLPVMLVYSEQVADKSNALKREAEIKSWSRKRKIELIRVGSSTVEQRTLNP